MNEATVQSVNHEVGDYVEKHDTLVVLETEKVALEIAAPETGIIQHLFVEEGDSITIGQAIAEITVESKPGNARNRSTSSEE